MNTGTEPARWHHDCLVGRVMTPGLWGFLAVWPAPIVEGRWMRPARAKDETLKPSGEGS